MRLLYYPGCTIKRNALEYEKKTLEILSKIGIEVYELENWYCCGAFYSLAKDDLMKYVGGLRTLIKAQVQARKYGTTKLLTLCPMCYNVLKRVNNMLRENPESLDTLTLFMDEEEKYVVRIEVLHLLEVLRDNVYRFKKLMVTEVKEIVVAPYYGCSVLRPKEIAFDNAENPQVMDDILKALNIEVVEFPFKTECCGAYHSIFNKEIVIEKSREIIGEAVVRGANTIAVICPLCKYNLETVLLSLNKKLKVKIVYLTDLLSQVMSL
jgi:heterodisulfide reductase subunit B